MEAVNTALTTAIGDACTAITNGVTGNLGTVLAVAAIFVAIPAVWKLVRRFAK